MLPNLQKVPILGLEWKGTWRLFTLFSTLTENVLRPLAEVAPAKLLTVSGVTYYMPRTLG